VLTKQQIYYFCIAAKIHVFLFENVEKNKKANRVVGFYSILSDAD